MISIVPGETLRRSRVSSTCPIRGDMKLYLMAEGAYPGTTLAFVLQLSYSDRLNPILTLRPSPPQLSRLIEPAPTLQGGGPLQQFPVVVVRSRADCR